MENDKKNDINEDGKEIKNTKAKKSETPKTANSKKSTTKSKKTASTKSSTKKKSTTSSKSSTTKKSTSKKSGTAKNTSTTRKTTARKKDINTEEKIEDLPEKQDVEIEEVNLVEEIIQNEVKQLQELKNNAEAAIQPGVQVETQEVIQLKNEKEFKEEIQEELQDEIKVEDNKEIIKNQDEKSNKPNDNKTYEKNKDNKLNEEEKLRGVSLVWLIAIIIVGIIFINSFYNICRILLDYKKIEDENKDLINDFTYTEEITEEKNDSENNDDKNENDVLKVKWDEIKEINNEVCSWIVIPGTNINYPVLKSEIRDKYLKTNIHGEYSNGGTIFIDSDVENPYINNNTIIYGHNLNSGEMFSDLEKYKDEEFAKNNNKIKIIMEDNTIKSYQIFAFYEINSDNSEIYNVKVTDLNNYYELINKYNKINISENIDKSKTILTLSTCTNYNEGTRFIVQAFCED